MDAFRAAMHAGVKSEEIVQMLPPPTLWTREFVSAVGDGIAAMRTKGCKSDADLLSNIFVGAKADAQEEQASPEAYPAGDETESDEEFDDVYPELNGSDAQKDVLVAKREALDKINYKASRKHVAKFAPWYFRISTSSSDDEKNDKTAVWSPCAVVSDFLGFRAGQELVGNGTQFKAMPLDVEHVGRFVSENLDWLAANNIATEDVPFRVARIGGWLSVEEFTRDMREARRCVLRYATEVRHVISHLRDVFEKLEEASTSGGPAAVMNVISAIDKRKRGRNDRIKLPSKNLNDEDKAFARELLPLDCGQIAGAEDGRKVLAVLHNLRVLASKHTDEQFPGAPAETHETLSVL